MDPFSITLRDRIHQLEIADKIKRLEKVDKQQAEKLGLRTTESIEVAKAKLVPFLSRTLDESVFNSRMQTCSDCSNNVNNICLLTGSWVDIFASITVAKCPEGKWL